jgi:hypothetical protein
MGDDQIAAGWYGGRKGVDDLLCLVVVGDEVQDAQQRYRDRTLESPGCSRGRQDGLGLSHVGVDVAGSAGRSAG